MKTVNVQISDENGKAKATVITTDNGNKNIQVFEGSLEEVKAKIISYNLTDKVTLLDWTKRTDVFNIIKNSKIYISTARYEGLPYSIIEALALSMPCIVTDSDGNRDLIVDGHNGYVIKNQNTIDFKDKIIHLLNNEVIHKQFSNNSRSEFLQKYNVENNIKNLEKIYIAYINK